MAAIRLIPNITYLLFSFIPEDKEIGLSPGITLIRGSIHTGVSYTSCNPCAMNLLAVASLASTRTVLRADQRIPYELRCGTIHDNDSRLVRWILLASVHFVLSVLNQEWVRWTCLLVHGLVRIVL